MTGSFRARRWRVLMPVAGLVALVATPLWLAAPVQGSRAVAESGTAPAIDARLTTATAPRAATALHGWERRFVASLPQRLRGRVTAVLAKPAGSPGCVTIPGGAEHGQAWLTGFANVTKLHGATLVTPALADIVALTKEIICGQSVTELSTEVPDFHGKHEFPPIRATFLAFGFVPVTATIQISQVGVGVIRLTLAGSVAPVAPYVVVAKAKLNVRVLSVKVNGVALPAGARCGTASPGTATLSNVNPTGEPGRNFWDIFTGGPLSGTIKLPHFARCGVGGDNLDSILDASISGSGNFTKLIQGVPCIFLNPLGSDCPPEVPKPRR